MNASVTHVDTALDIYCARMKTHGTDPQEFKAITLAQYVRLPRETVSMDLQVYLAHQQYPGKTQYVVGCQGYGRSARWSILARPGADAVTFQRERKRAAKWEAADSMRRYVRSQARIIRPGTNRYAAPDDALIEAVSQLAADQFAAIVKYVDAALA